MEETETPTGLNLKDLIKTDTTDMRAEVEFKDGIFFNLKFLARADLTKLSKDCTVYKYDSGTRTRQPSLDSDKLIRKFCALAVEGWRGMTPRNLSKLIPMKGVPSSEMDSEIPFSQEQLVTLVKNSSEIDAFLQQTSTDVNFFNESLEHELGNSEASQSGS